MIFCSSASTDPPSSTRKLRRAEVLVILSDIPRMAFIPAPAAQGRHKAFDPAQHTIRSACTVSQPPVQHLFLLCRPAVALGHVVYFPVCLHQRRSGRLDLGRVHGVPGGPLDLLKSIEGSIQGGVDPFAAHR